MEAVKDECWTKRSALVEGGSGEEVNPIPRRARGEVCRRLKDDSSMPLPERKKTHESVSILVTVNPGSG
jgi:hypothetical protein